jgi:hypothetical protein
MAAGMSQGELDTIKTNREIKLLKRSIKRSNAVRGNVEKHAPDISYEQCSSDF